MKTWAILAIIVALLGAISVAAKITYDAGYNERDRIALEEAAKATAAAQVKINLIEKQAVTDAQKNADLQLASKVSTAVANARAANPACSLLVPNTVIDALKRH